TSTKAPSGATTTTTWCAFAVVRSGSSRKTGSNTFKRRYAGGSDISSWITSTRSSASAETASPAKKPLRKESGRVRRSGGAGTALHRAAPPARRLLAQTELLQPIAQASAAHPEQARRLGDIAVRAAERGFQDR